MPGLSPASTVLDLGAGTGKLTRLLVRTFERVIAVEPAAEMRRLNPGAIAGTAEAIPLADESVDAVFVAEAFHRFDGQRALAEIARVLRPGGALVLLWNLPAGPTEPSIAAAEDFLRERAPEVDYDPVDLNTRRYSSGAWREPFAGAPFEELREARLPNPQAVDREGIVAFLASMGWVGDLPDEERLRLLDEVRSRLVDAEHVRQWETHVHWTRLRRVEA